MWRWSVRGLVVKTRLAAACPASLRCPTGRCQSAFIQPTTWSAAYHRGRVPTQQLNRARESTTTREMTRGYEHLRKPAGRLEAAGHVHGQRGQREEVSFIVQKNALHSRAGLVLPRLPHPGPKKLRDLGTREVVNTCEPELSLLQGSQPTVRKLMLVDPPCRMEQIEVSDAELAPHTETGATTL